MSHDQNLNDPVQLLSREDAAKELGVGVDLIKEWINRGAIRVVSWKEGHARRFGVPVADVDRMRDLSNRPRRQS